MIETCSSNIKTTSSFIGLRLISIRRTSIRFSSRHGSRADRKSRDDCFVSQTSLLPARHVFTSPRNLMILYLPPRNHVHAFCLNSVEDLDREFIKWIRETYAVGGAKT